MTNKDYNALAAALAKVRPDSHNAYNVQVYNEWVKACAAVAQVCKTDNVSFDMYKFVDACKQ